MSKQVGKEVQKFRSFIAKKIDFEKSFSSDRKLFKHVYRYGNYGKRTRKELNMKKEDFEKVSFKVSYLLKLSRYQFEKGMGEVEKMVMTEMFREYVKIQKKRQKENAQDEEASTIVDYDDISRTSMMNLIISFFRGDEHLSLEKRVVEKEYVDESVDEVHNIFITFRMKDVTFEIPKHVILKILTFLEYDRTIFYGVGRVCKDFYLIILSTWRRIRVTPKNVFKISILALKNLSELSFSRKSISISKKELDYIWDSITPSSIRIFDISKCYGGGINKFLNSIMRFNTFKPENEEEEEKQEQQLPIIFDRCQTFLFPTEKFIEEKFHKDFRFSTFFPNITCLHINSNQLSGLSDHHPSKSLTSIRELHITFLSDLTTFNQTDLPRLFDLNRLRRLKLRMKEFTKEATYHTRDDPKNDFYSKFFCGITKKMVALESLTFELFQKYGGSASWREFFLFDQEGISLPESLQELEIFYGGYISENTPFLSKNLINPNCRRIKICPLKVFKSNHVNSFFETVMSWDPIPTHYDIGLDYYRGNPECVNSYLSLVYRFLKLLHDNNNQNNNNNKKKEDENKKIENFRIYMYSKKDMIEKRNSVRDQESLPGEKYIGMKYTSSKNTLVIHGFTPWTESTNGNHGVEKKKEIGKLIGLTKCIQKIIVRVRKRSSRARRCSAQSEMLQNRRHDSALRKTVIPSRDVFRSVIRLKVSDIMYYRVRKDMSDIIF